MAGSDNRYVLDVVIYSYNELIGIKSFPSCQSCKFVVPLLTLFTLFSGNGSSGF